jgi:hypothetical protein
MRLRRCLPSLAAALALAAAVVVPVVTRAAPAAALDTSGQPVMGTSRISAAQLAAFFRANTRSAYRATVPIDTLTAYYVFEGNVENVRGDVAFAQAIVETGWFNYPDSGMVRPWYNNFAGMNACGGCNVFQAPNAQLGVRAQIQHLRLYADPTVTWQKLHFPLVDPLGTGLYNTFFKRGVAPTWSQMGNGNWAMDPTYATKVLALYNRMLLFAGLPSACPPDALGLNAPGFAAGCPTTLRQPGRAIAANPLGGYYVLNGDGHVSAFGGAVDHGSSAFGFEIARDIAVMPDGGGYVVLDGWGGVHKFGSAVNLPSPDTYWPGWDIARGIAITRDGRGLVVVDGWGGVHKSGTASSLPSPSTYWPGWDIARSVALSSADGVHSTGISVLDGWGGVHVAGTARALPTPYWPGWDIARSLVVSANGSSQAVLDGFGGIHAAGSYHSLRVSGYVAADRWRGVTISGNSYLTLRSDGFATKN